MSSASSHGQKIAREDRRNIFCGFGADVVLFHSSERLFWSGHVTNDVLHAESCLLIVLKPFLFLILAQN